MRIIWSSHFYNVSCSELRELVIRFSRDFGIFPNFEIVVCNPKDSWYDRWGVLLLSEIPEGERLKAFDRYLLLAGLGFHGIMPATELNRLLIWVASRRVFGTNLHNKVYGFLISIFSLLSTVTLLAGRHYWSEIVRKTLGEILETMPRPRSRLGRLIAEYFGLIIGRGSEETSTALRTILESPISTYAKSKLFFEIIAKIEKDFEPWEYYERDLRRIVMPISWDMDMVGGKEWLRSALSPKDIEQLAEIDENFAIAIARRLDKRKRCGKMPAYSPRRTMLQKLLRERRYLAAARRARIRRILSTLETLLLSSGPTLTHYGYHDWYIGDDEERLNVEVSVDTFGRVVPNLSTLGEIFERGGERLSDTIGHLELCIDTSGSMDGEPIERAIDVGVALVEIAKKYEKTIGLTTFSSGAWSGIKPTQDYDIAEEIILRLEAEGGTNIRHVFRILEDHLSYAREKALVAIITDTMIYDINYPSVVRLMEDLSTRAKILMIVIGEDIWERSREIILGMRLSTIIIPPKGLNSESISTLIGETEKALRC